MSKFKLSRSIAIFFVMLLVTAIVVWQYTSIQNLKEEKELAIQDARRAMNNLLAEQDSVRTLVKENGGIVASKRSFEYTIDELKKTNKNLINEYSDALGDLNDLKKVNSLLKTELQIVNSIKSEISEVEQHSTTNATISFSKQDDFGKGNSRNFKGTVNVSYIDSVFSANPGEFELAQTIKLYAMTDEIDGMNQIRIATDYPGITFGEIENINLINNKLSKPKKKSGWSIGVGGGYGFSLSGGQTIQTGPYLGVGAFWSPKWLRF